MPDITKSVGKGGLNVKADVRIIQTLLNNFTGVLGLNVLPVDGFCGSGTIAVIEKFQGQFMGFPAPDGKISPGGRTITALNGKISAASTTLLSGAAWWHANQAKYLNSERLEDLEPDFRTKAKTFIAAMRAGSARVTISSTRRNKIRAYLMHYSWRISEGSIAARNAPPQLGCAIVWDHGDEVKSRAAAREMRSLFDLVFEPSLASRHIDGKAVDMTINWAGTLKMLDGQGKTVSVGAPNNGGDNSALHRIGASYGVIKLLSDKPHWSSDGH
jgi:peptidoglycan hydrolase-like protein with peptidoglycan-binding domain